MKYKRRVSVAFKILTANQNLRISYLRQLSTLDWEIEQL